MNAMVSSMDLEREASADFVTRQVGVIRDKVHQDQEERGVKIAGGRTGSLRLV